MNRTSSIAVAILGPALAGWCGMTAARVSRRWSAAGTACGRLVFRRPVFRWPACGWPDFGWRGGVAAAWGLLLILPLAAQENATGPPAAGAAEDRPSPPTTVADIDTRLKELESRTDLDESTVATITDLYTAAKESLVAAETQRGRAASLQQQVSEAPETIQAAQQRLSRTIPADSPSPLLKPAAELQAELAEKLAALPKARDELNRLSAEPARRQTRLREIPPSIQELEERRGEIQGQLEQIDPDEDPVVSAARRAQLSSALQAIEQEIAALTMERDLYAATAELVPMERELTERQIQRLETEIERWQSAIADRRKSEIDRLAQQAAALAGAIPPSLRNEAERNQELVEQIREVSLKLTQTSRRGNKSEAKLKQIKADFETAQTRVEAVGLNDTLGLMLRRLKSTLTETRSQFVADPDAIEEIRQLQVGLFEYQDMAAESAETTASIEALLASAEVPAGARDELTEDVKQILAQRREILGVLTQTQSELFNQLYELSATRQLIVHEIDAFVEYINERILWIRSAPLLWKEDLDSLVAAVRWVVRPQNGVALLQAISVCLRDKFGLFLFLISASLLLTAFGPRLRATIGVAGESARSHQCRHFTPTLEAAAGTSLLAAYWPLMFLAAGWLLVDSSPEPFIQASAQSLVWVSLTLFPFELLRQTCRTGGLGQYHFDWPEPACRHVSANLRWFNPLLAILLYLICLLQYQPNEAYRNSLGRVTMIALLTVLGVYALRVLHPTSRMYTASAHWLHGAVWYRFRTVRFYVVSALLAALLLFTVTGYYYSTYQVGTRLMQTALLVIGFLHTYMLASRWLLVRRRRIHLERLAIRREELKQQPAVEQSLGHDVRIELKPEVEVDIDDASRQSQQLVLIFLGFVALWIAWRIWADVLPAIQYLEAFKLWPVGESGLTEWVTLWHLIRAVVAVLVTLIAVKNLPGILEFLLLKRLPMDAGGRYAVVTIVRYLLTLVGIVIACTIIKLPWSQLGWLVAAISVGLGFGLQEIVANFVSGIILLLERPVRVGDIVTIEGTTGVVSRIQMRATTVTNWDQQELVVPNKNLITNSLFNWTLSNVVTRLTIPVGVSYRADANRVFQVITEEVRAHPEVLSDPEPSVTFENFGDSSLNFVIRCCVSGLNKRLETTHQLHVAIHQRLAAEGIEIPFPQRDIHIIESPKEP